MFPCHPEAEPEVEELLVSDITPESFRLTWAAEEDVFDTFVLMVRDSANRAQVQEVVIAGEERSTVITELSEDTEYQVEISGLILERRSQTVSELARTGIWYCSWVTSHWPQWPIWLKPDIFMNYFNVVDLCCFLLFLLKC